jgi:hypothetical protein
VFNSGAKVQAAFFGLGGGFDSFATLLFLRITGDPASTGASGAV